MSLATVTFIAELKIHRLQTKKVNIFQNQKFMHETQIKLNNRKRKSVFRGKCSSNKNWESYDALNNNCCTYKIYYAFNG